MLSTQLENSTVKFKFANDITKSEEITVDLIEELEKKTSLNALDRKIVEEIKLSLLKTGVLPFEWSKQEQNFVDSHGKDRWIEYLVYRHKFKLYPANAILLDFPIYLLIEPTSICNLRCTMCFQSDSTFTKKPYWGMMDFDLYKKVVDQAHEGGTKAITLASRGEPTLHKQFSEMLSYASQEKFIDFKINTNATKLTESLCHDILQSDVNELVFSIDAATPELYEQIRVGGKFDEVLRNIKTFQEIREKHYPQSKLNTRVSGVIFRKDQDVDMMNRFWSEIVDDVAFVGGENVDVIYDARENPERNHRCSLLWQSMYVWFDGLCNPCYADYKSLLAVGNVKEKSIREIWLGDSYKKIREDHYNARRTCHNPCNRCDM